MKKLELISKVNKLLNEEHVNCLAVLKVIEEYNSELTSKEVERQINSSFNNRLEVVYTPEFVANFAAELFRVKLKDLVGKSRERNLVYIRYCCYYYLKKNTNYTLTKIGQTFGRDHGTVINGLTALDNAFFVNDEVMLNPLKTLLSALAKLNDKK